MDARAMLTMGGWTLPPGAIVLLIVGQRTYFLSPETIWFQQRKDRRTQIPLTPSPLGGSSGFEGGHQE